MRCLSVFNSKLISPRKAWMHGLLNGKSCLVKGAMTMPVVFRSQHAIVWNDQLFADTIASE
jgi:hypothetical protein